jgi:hypothetical protein
MKNENKRSGNRLTPLFTYFCVIIQDVSGHILTADGMPQVNSNVGRTRLLIVSDTTVSFPFLIPARHSGRGITVSAAFSVNKEFNVLTGFNLQPVADLTGGNRCLSIYHPDVLHDCNLFV